MKLYPADCTTRLEFDRIVRRLSSFCRSAGAAERANALLPLSDEGEIRLRLKRCAEFQQLIQSGHPYPNATFPDLLREIRLLRTPGTALTEQQFMNIRELVDTSNTLVKYLSSRKETLGSIASLFDSVYVSEEIISGIDRILDISGTVKSSASADLATIRVELSRARRDLDKAFRVQLQRFQKLGWLADAAESVYNGRRVLAVVSGQKRSVRGLLHGTSESGKTSFIEPAETVELNNEVYSLLDRERREIRKILAKLSAETAKHLPLIIASRDALIQFDFVRASALLGKEMDGMCPEITGKPEVHLLKARHPVLVLQNLSNGKTVVPMSCSLDSKRRLLVISGPNAGGKSIALKTVGLIQMMAQSGLPVPLEAGSRLGIFHQLFTDIGDNQSIEYELSTYSSRLKRMKHFLDFADKRILLLIDEFGTGTDPELGGAMAEAMLEELTRRKPLGIITTHYMNIKLAASRLDGVQNASMLFDEHTLQPRYELSIGQPGSSYTYVIAEKAGLPVSLIQRAQNLTDTRKLDLDNLLRELYRQQQDQQVLAAKLAQHKAEAEESRRKYGELYARWKQRLEKGRMSDEKNSKLPELGRKFSLLMQEWEKASDKKPVMQKLVRLLNSEKRKKIDKKLREKKEKDKARIIEKRKQEITVGSRVKLLKGRQTGVVEEILNNRARVLFGNIKTLASLDTLELVLPKDSGK